MKTVAVVPFVLAVVVTAMAETLGTASGVSANLRVEAATGTVEDVVPVNIDVVGMPAPGLGAWTVDMQYDPRLLGLAPQGLLGRGCQPYFGGVCSMQYSANIGRFTGASATGLVGDFTLGTAFFRCLTPGTSPLTLTTNVFADATPDNPQQISIEIQNGTITCVEAPPPAPTAKPRAVLPAAGYGGDARSGDSVWTAALLAIGAATLGAGALGLRRQR